MPLVWAVGTLGAALVPAVPAFFVPPGVNLLLGGLVGPGLAAKDLLGLLAVDFSLAGTTFWVITLGCDNRFMLSCLALLVGRRARAALLSTVVGRAVREVGAVVGRDVVLLLLVVGLLAADWGLWLIGVLAVVGVLDVGVLAALGAVGVLAPEVGVLAPVVVGVLAPLPGVRAPEAAGVGLGAAGLALLDLAAKGTLGAAGVLLGAEALVVGAFAGGAALGLGLAVVGVFLVASGFFCDADVAAFGGTRPPAVDFFFVSSFDCLAEAAVTAAAAVTAETAATPATTAEGLVDSSSGGTTVSSVGSGTSS